MKDDVIGALGVAMIEHRWNAEQTEQKVREFINAHYRQFTRFGRSRSILLFDGGGATLADIVTRYPGD